MSPAEIAALLEREHAERTAYHSLAPPGSLTPAEALTPAGTHTPAGTLTPAALADAYAAQEALVARLALSQGRTVGYKVGLTAARMQQLCGLSQPVAGHVLEGRVQASPAQLSLEGFVRLGIESELCLILAGELPPRARAYGRDEVAGALGAAHAAFELVDDRGADYAQLEAFTLIADNSWNAGLVLGAGRNARSIDLGTLTGVLRVDGRSVDSGRSADALGDPLRVLAWLANHLSARGQGLKPGDRVLTGSLVPTRFARRGEHYRFEIETLGAVELRVR